MNRDLTTGKPSAVLWRFCLPLFGSIIFQKLYGIADSFVAGKIIGEEALAHRILRLRAAQARRTIVGIVDANASKDIAASQGARDFFTGSPGEYRNRL